MTRRRVLVALLLGAWVALTAAWGWNAAIVFGFFVFVAGATPLRLLRRNDRSLGWGCKHFDELLNDRRRR